MKLEKKYRPWILSLAAGLLLASGSNAYAGAGGSGGGKSVVCRATDGRILRATLLDLYEATSAGIALKPSQGDFYRDYADFLKEYERLIDRTNPVAPSSADARDTLSNLHFTADGKHLPSLNDTGPLAPLPPDCRYEQLAIFHDPVGGIDQPVPNDETSQMTIEVDSEIWSHLDSQNQAALLAHEQVWVGFRWAGDLTSESARKAVRLIFSAEKAHDLKQGLPDDARSCTTQEHSPLKVSAFYLYPDPRNPKRTMIQFMQIAGRVPFSPLRISLDAPISADQLEYGHLQDIYSTPLIVQDAQARFDRTLPISEGIFQGYKAHIRYVFGEPMEVTLLSPEGQMLRRSLVGDCHDIEWPFSEGVW